MTHEYVIGLGGIIAAEPVGGEPATAIAWAADRVLAVGPDEAVSAISRGDSIFLDLAGCTVTPLPEDPARAVRVLQAAGVGAPGVATLIETLAGSGLLPAGGQLEPGSPADLACWAGNPIRLLATVVGGAFTEHDEHHGPFYPA